MQRRDHSLEVCADMLRELLGACPKGIPIASRTRDAALRLA